MAKFGHKVQPMQAAAQNELGRVEDYLAAETAGEVRHEYLGLKLSLPLSAIYEGI